MISKYINTILIISKLNIRFLILCTYLYRNVFVIEYCVTFVVTAIHCYTGLIFRCIVIIYKLVKNLQALTVENHDNIICVCVCVRVHVCVCVRHGKEIDEGLPRQGSDVALSYECGVITLYGAFCVPCSHVEHGLVKYSHHRRLNLYRH